MFKCQPIASSENIKRETTVSVFAIPKLVSDAAIIDQPSLAQLLQMLRCNLKVLIVWVLLVLKQKRVQRKMQIHEISKQQN